LHGDDYKWLHNRACIRLGQRTPSKKPKSGQPPAHRESIKSVSHPAPKPVAECDYKWHKEGVPGERGAIICLGLQEGVARRSFAFVGNERDNPFPQPTGAKLFVSISPEEIASRGLTPEALDVHVPPGKVAIILWDHNMVHGIHPGGVGVQLYLSAASPAKIQYLQEVRDGILKKQTRVRMHDVLMRQPRAYYDTVQLGFLYGCCDMLWPSGKPIPAHSVQGQSVGSNQQKFPNNDYTFHLRRDGTVDNGPEMRSRLDAMGIRVPEIAYDIPHKWVRDPSILSAEQLYRWGFAETP